MSSILQRVWSVFSLSLGFFGHVADSFSRCWTSSFSTASLCRLRDLVTGASRPVVVAEGIVGEASLWSVQKQRRIVESAIQDVSPLDGQRPCLFYSSEGGLSSRLASLCRENGLIKSRSAAGESGMVGPAPAFYPSLSNQIVMIVAPASPSISWVAATRNTTKNSLGLAAPLMAFQMWNLGDLRHKRAYLEYRTTL